MKVLLTSDLHQFIPKWVQLRQVVVGERPDLVLVAGDLLPKRGGLDAQRAFLPQLEGHLAAMRDAGATVALFLGNDDAHVLEPALDELAARGLCVNVNCRVFRFRELAVCGMPFVRDYPFGYKAWVRRDDGFVASPVQFCGEGLTLDAEGRWVEIPSLEEFLHTRPSLRDELERVRTHLGPDELRRSLWMVHQPPAGLGMDICASGERVGSPTVLEFIREHQPLAGVSGHIHESPYQPGGRWVDSVGPTIWFQPGQMGVPLHYVSLEISADFAVQSVRHSVFGAPKTGGT